jgi:hypothetical protein
MEATTTPFEDKLSALGLGKGWRCEKGSWWLEVPEPFDVRANTAILIKLGARFVAITAIERPDKEVRLDYQWDLNGQLLSFMTATSAHKITTIADLIPAADWVERETYEYFAVEFAGRSNTLPLMLRAGDAVGINLHKEAVQ